MPRHRAGTTRGLILNSRVDVPRRGRGTDACGPARGGSDARRRASEGAAGRERGEMMRGPGGMAMPRSGVLRFLGIGAILAGASGCQSRNQYAPPPPPAVTVAHPVQRPITEFVELTGTTQA